MKRALIITFSVVALLASPASTRADVLVSSPDPSPVCGDAIHVGIWYRPYPRKNTLRERRFVIKAIDDRSGRVWWTKHATATTRWRDWYLPSGWRGRCRPTTVVYYHNGGKVYESVKIRFRSEGV